MRAAVSPFLTCVIVWCIAIDSIIAANAETKTAPGFLDLPPELRNRIYHLVLVKDVPVLQQTTVERAGERRVLGILGVNRQIGDEAFGIYYGLNTFRFYCICDCVFASDISIFLRSIGEKGLAHVKTIQFEQSKEAKCMTDFDYCEYCDDTWLVGVTIARRTAEMLHGFECWAAPNDNIARPLNLVQETISAALCDLGIEREEKAPTDFLNFLERAFGDDAFCEEI